MHPKSFLWSAKVPECGHKTTIESNYFKCLDANKVQILTFYLSRKPQIIVTGNTGVVKILENTAGLSQGLVSNRTCEEDWNKSPF